MRGPMVVAVLYLAVGAGCAPTSNAAADEAAIRAVDSQMVAALNGRNLDAWLAHLADDARMLPPHAPAVEGKDAISQLLRGLLSLPNFSVVHHPAKVTVARSGDLAYMSYDYELTVPDTAGGSVTEKGKDISIFQKRADGSWALTADIWSPDK